MVEAADYISNKIRDEGLLVRAFESDPVITYTLCLTEIIKEVTVETALNKLSKLTLR